MYTRSLLIILFALWGCLSLFSMENVPQHYYFRNLDIEQGLPQNTINDILQDRQGFMWFGTKDGLSRYDGISFRNFRNNPQDVHSLGNNFVTSLYEDTEGNIWVGTDAGLYVYHPLKDRFESFSISSVENTKITRSVTMVTGDAKGNIWVAVESQGIFSYNLQSRELHNYTFEKFSISSNVECIAFDNSGTVWIGFYGDGLFYSKDHLKSISPFLSPEGKKVFDKDVVLKIIAGDYNCLYISSIKKGVQELNLTSGQLRSLLLVDEFGESIFCRDLLSVSNEELWLGTETGIYILNIRTGKYSHQRSSLYDAYSLSDNAIYSLYKDREGGIWIGSYFGGVDYFSYSPTPFEKYYPRGGENDGLHGKRIREFCQDQNGILWIGTEDGGLNRFDPHTKKFSFFKPSEDFTNIHGLCLVDDKLWVGTFSKGLKIIDTNTGRIVKTYLKSNTAGSLIDNSIFSICRTASGDIYLGTMFGLLKYDKSTDGFRQIQELQGCFVYDIREDSNGNIWLATYANGAFRYDINEKRWKNYLHEVDKEGGFPSNKVLSIFEDSRRRVWLTTQGGGFCRFVPEEDAFITYNQYNGFPYDVVYQIAEGKKGMLWLSTNSGLVCFDTDTEQRKVYTTNNGLLSDQFNYRSSFVSADGTIYFGCIEGFVAFNPDTFSENKNFPPLVITNFMLFNKEVYAGQQDSPLRENIVFSDSIVLNSNQNSFSIRLAALSYQAPRMNKLMYKLDDFDQKWQILSENPVITYSNLPYGNYVFRAKASNGDGYWNPEERILHICILPPIYLSVWAYIIYILTFVAVVVLVVMYFRKRNHRRHQLQLEKFEQEKEREIYHAKIDFFTNVAHEIRTPLTLINGPLENIILKKQLDAETREDLGIMKQNTERLLNLTNQLLDFRKAEGQGYRLNFLKCNITKILKETHLRFTSLAKQKGLDFTLHVPEEDFYAPVNQEAFTKIISNLLNNGVKYAYSYVHIYLELPDGKNEFCIRTVNDGVVIPDDMKEEIFSAFVRFNEQQDGKVTTGTGIGLALSRSLAELHGGTLVMEKGETVNCFRLTLPVVQNMAFTLDSERKDIVSTKMTTDEQVSEDEQSDKKEKKYTILVVEDNPDMLSFVARQLSHDYAILTATNGVEALQVLDEHFVNLIVSDVMMPHMDGFELCKAVKSNLDYSHVPVILLTAKNNIQSKIEGLELGADAYIEKPFSVEYLKASISSLMNNREKLRQAFAKSPFVAANTMALTKADEGFMKKLNEIISANLHDPDFNMDTMAELLHMSRSNFYRKMKGVLDLTPNDYLRLERLKLAAQLLKEGNERVNEICYKVGFNSPSYFSKCFQKQFGVLPKDFVG